MPSAVGRPNIFSVHEQASWLVMSFEQLLVFRANRQALRSGRKARTGVGEKRRLGFYRSACDFLWKHELGEVADVLDWLFSYHGGELPGQVRQNPAAYMPKKRLADLLARDKSIPLNFTRKVTNLHQVFAHYGQLVELMHIAVSTSPSRTLDDVDDRLKKETRDDFASLKNRSRMTDPGPHAGEFPSSTARILGPPPPTPGPVTPWQPGIDDDDDDEQLTSQAFMASPTGSEAFFAQHPVRRRIGPCEYRAGNIDMANSVAERRTRYAARATPGGTG